MGRMRIVRGTREHVDTLWEDARRAAGPIVEPAEGGRYAVTFVWRGDAGRVTLGGQFLDWTDTAATDLTRVPGGDVWHLTLLLPRDLTISYAFLLDCPHDAITDKPDATAIVGGQRSDPNNPRHMRYDIDTTGIEPYPGAHDRSELYLPDAAPSTWSTPGDAPAGKVTMHTLRAADTSLATDHRVWVYEPASTRPGPYPTVVIFDGDCYVGPLVPTPTILDNLIAAGRIPPTIAILVESLDNRNIELNGDPSFLEFLRTDLFAWAGARWPVTADPARTVAAGASFGGVCAAFTALTAPERYGLVLSQSGAFQRPGPAAHPDGPIAAYPVGLATRFWLDAGTFEEDLLDANRAARETLRAKGYDPTYHEFVGGHDYLAWRDTLARGLIALLGEA